MGIEDGHGSHLGGCADLNRQKTMYRRLIKRAREFERQRAYAKTVVGDPVHAQRIAADADHQLLEDLEKLMVDPKSGLTPERRRHGAELLEAVRWWVQNHSGEYFETKPGQSSCGYILERYKESR